MALPKIMAPEFTTKIPSTKQEVKFRPFLVKEEKLLFMAAQSDDPGDIADAIAKTLQNCLITDVDVSTLAAFDLEYMFLQLRSKSVGEVVQLQMAHRGETECKHIHQVEVDLGSIELIFDEDHSNVIKITDDIGVVMRYPGIGDMAEVQKAVTSEDQMDMFAFATKLITQVYDGENVYDDFTDEELMDFVESLSNDQFTNIMQFYDTMPKLRHLIEWTCPECGETETTVVEGLAGFFT